MRVIFHREQAGVGSQPSGFGVKSHQAAAFAAGNILDAVKAEADHIAETADLAAVMLAAERMGGVFNDAQSLAAGKVIDLVEVPGVAGIVHVHEGYGIGGKAFFGIGQIKGAGFCQHIAGHRHAACGADGLKGRHKGQGGHKHFGLARHRALGGHCVDGQMQGRRARIGCNDLIRPYAEILGHFFFKKAHFIAHAKIAVFKKNTADGTGLCFTHYGTGKTHGHTASCCAGDCPAGRRPSGGCGAACAGSPGSACMIWCISI